MQPDQHLHAMTLCIGMPNLINMLLSSFCFCAANWNVNYSTFVHFYTVNWNVQPDQHLYASTLHIGMWTTQCFWYFYAANWSVQLIKHFLSFLLIRFFSILLFFSCSLFWVLLEMILQCFYDDVFFSPCFCYNLGFFFVSFCFPFPSLGVVSFLHSKCIVHNHFLFSSLYVFLCFLSFLGC